MVKNQKNRSKKQSGNSGLINAVIISILLIITIMFLVRTNLYKIVNIYDEGNIAYASQLVSDGSVPYRDFWSIYAPAQYYCVALMYKIFGTSLTTLRMWDILLRVALVMAIFIIARRISGVYFALLSWASALIWLGYLQWYGYPAVPAVLFCLISLEFLRLFLENGKSRELFLAGLFCGVTALFRVDFGIYTIISSAAGLALIYIIKPVKIAPRVIDIAPYLYGFMAVVAVPAVYFLSVAGAREVFYDLLFYPAFILTGYRHLKFPNLLSGSFFDNFPYYYPVIVCAVSAFFMYKAISSKKTDKEIKRRAIAVFPVLIVCVLYFIQLKSRTDFAHLEPFLIVAILLQSFVYSQLFTTGNAVKYGLLALLLAANITVLVTPLRDVFTELKRQPPQQSALKRAGRAVLNGDMQKAIEFVQSKTAKDDYIFCGNTYHDRVIGNDIMSYFLSERRSATKYFCLDPGSADTPKVQKRIVSDLVEKNVKYIILFSGFEGAVEPNKTSVSSGCFILDDFINGNFTKIWEAVPFSVLEKKLQ